MKKSMLWVTGMLLVLILGCRVASPVSLITKATATPEFQFEVDGFSFGQQEWPDYLPQDIPPIPGTINTIMADDFRVRIFFDDMSEKDMQLYLQQFEDIGYSLKYLLFYSDGQQEPTQKEINSGKYDAVDISKGEIAIRIEYGDNEGTMDINVNQLDVEVDDEPHWPSELIGVVPEPDCELSAAYTQSDGTISVMCDIDEPGYLMGYADKLIASGYEVINQSENQDQEVYHLSLSNGELYVELRAYGEEQLGILVY